jgi:phosphoribosylanthranilate isomerase
VSIFVKICGLSTAEQVDAALSAGADAIGFVFADSVRRVSPATAAQLGAAIPAGIKKVAVMLHATDEELQAVLREFKPDALQTDASDFAQLDVPDNIERWPVFREGDSPAATDETYIYEGKKSGSGQTVDWTMAAKIARQGNMMLAGGLAANNVAGAIVTVAPFGVDVSSAVESAPGIKDAQLIKEFIKAARAAEAHL